MKVKFKYIFILLLCVLTVSGFLVYMSGRKGANETVVFDKLPSKVEAVAPQTTGTVTSPDGKKTLTMKSLTKDGQTTYTFYSDDVLAYTRITTGKMSIPYNTWSIDDKAFFVKEDVGGASNFYIVPGDINISQKFAEKLPGNILQDVTGWAASNLVVVNANDGKNDISYWFDTTSQTFIRLSNRFN